MACGNIERMRGKLQQLALTPKILRAPAAKLNPIVTIGKGIAGSLSWLYRETGL